MPHGKAYFKHFERKSHIKILFLKNLDKLFLRIFLPNYFMKKNIIISYSYFIDMNKNT